MNLTIHRIAEIRRGARKGREYGAITDSEWNELLTLAQKALRPPTSADLASAAVAFRESLVPHADRMAHGQYPLWHGWALYDAFVAGAQWKDSHTK